MLIIFLQANEVTEDQFWTGVAIIGGIVLLSYLVTKYTKDGGGSDYGAGREDYDDGDMF